MEADESSRREMCAVCHDQIAPGQVYITLCQHTFCKTDITRCRNCPVCRQPLALTASAAALAGSLRTRRNLLDVVLPHARRAVSDLSSAQGSADERVALDTVERLLVRVQSDEEQWLAQNDLITINQFVMLAHTPVVPVMLWPTLMAMVMIDRDRSGQQRVDLMDSLYTLDDRGDELSKWILDYVRLDIDWARRAAEVQYEIYLADGNLTRAAGRMWEWKRSAAMQNHMTSVALLIDDALTPADIGGKRRKRDLHDARQRALRARHILITYSFAVNMMQLTEHLRFTLVQLGVDRDAVPAEIIFLTQAMTPPGEGEDEGYQFDFGLNGIGQEEEEDIRALLVDSNELQLPGFVVLSPWASPAVSPTTATTRVTRGPRQR